VCLFSEANQFIANPAVAFLDSSSCFSKLLSDEQKLFFYLQQKFKYKFRIFDTFLIFDGVRGDIFCANLDHNSDFSS